MSRFNPFEITSIPPVGHLYFFYGLAFFFMGVSILFKHRQSSDLKLAKSLWLLAGFGLTHGSHEWLELYLLLQKPYLPLHEIVWFQLIEVIFVVVSFLFLLQFGTDLVLPHKGYRKWLRVLPFILFFSWLTYLSIDKITFDIAFFKKADVSARHTFAFLGGLVTAVGFVISSRESRMLSVPVSRKLLLAGFFFLLYGVVAGLIPSHTRVPYLDVRIEVFRGICAVLITFYIIEALNIFDIELKRKLEHRLLNLAQSEKLISLGKLAAGIAHEINNPLTNVYLNIQLLKDRLNPFSGQEALSRLEQMEINVHKASYIAQELLQFSRNTHTHMKAVNINNVIKGALTLLQYKMKDITLHQTLSRVPPIEGDALKLEQALINILDNSVHAMDGSGDLCIETSLNAHRVHIKIADSGKGIKRDDMPKVFDPFYTTKDIGTGTGLGLSISYSIIAQHEGAMDIESTEGEGTIVTIDLPLNGNRKGNGK